MPEFQKNMLTKRWRKVRPREPSEYQIQTAVMQQWAWRKREGVTVFHIPNGGWRNPVTGARLKEMGVLPGVADLCFVWGELVAAPGLLVLPRVLFLELKRRGGKESPVQIDFATDMKSKGCFCEVADSVDAAMAVLIKHGLLKGRVGAKPDQVESD